MSLTLFTLFKKLDFPTLGKPHNINVLVYGSIEGKRDKC